MKVALRPLTDYPQRTFEIAFQLAAPLGASEPVTLLDHILAVVAAIIAPMKKRLLRKRKKITTPKMDDLNSDTKMKDVENHIILDPVQQFAQSLQNAGEGKKSYERSKKELIKRETNKAWDHEATISASEPERKAGEIIWRIREDERDVLFGNKASEAIPGPETLDMGGQFLTNKGRIEKGSLLYQIAKRLPKGCHLHLHFNAELNPTDLLANARKIPNMFIRSTEPLLDDESFARSELVFNVMPKDTPSIDIFSPGYKPEFRAQGATPWMKWSEFIIEFEKRRQITAEKFIMGKMILSEEEVYGISQTTNGIWARFNQATRCFKGLLNYQTVYEDYIGQAIDSMIADGVMYAELRPMLMDKTIPANNGVDKLDHDEQMRMILRGVGKKQEQLLKEGRLDKFKFGLKIIYCAPRSIPKTWMQREIQDCIRLKMEFPDLICGFDLVGAEDRPNHIGYYREELLAMVETCEKLNLDIPFLFHAGETLLDTGGSKDPTNSNLYDAVLFNAKRIGHGFSLLKHPVLVEEFKSRPICIELCPTSNELLHLCRNIKEHPYPEILAMGIPCTVNSDNPSLFSNSVSHEFYQVMVGSPSMNIHGWRQLVEWSVEHSRLNVQDKEEARRILKREWEEFCLWVIETYGLHAEGLDVKL